MRHCDDPEHAIPEAEMERFMNTALNAHLAAKAGFVGIAACLLESARRRAKRLEAAGETWAAALLLEYGSALDQLCARYGELD